MRWQQASTSDQDDEKTMMKIQWRLEKRKWMNIFRDVKENSLFSISVRSQHSREKVHVTVNPSPKKG